MNDSDLAFYHDQNGARINKCLSVIENPSGSDINFQKRINLKTTRKDTQAQSSATEMLYLESSASSQESSSSSDFSPPRKQMKFTEDIRQNKQFLKNLAVICERYQISDREGAAVATATLKDFGIISKHDAPLIIDRSN